MADNPRMVIRAEGLEALGEALELLAENSTGEVREAFQAVQQALIENTEPLDAED